MESLEEKERREFTPATGANVVGFDDWGKPGEYFYMVGHYDTVEEAEQALAKRLKEKPDEDLLILSPATSTPS